MFWASATMWLSPQVAGRTYSPPRCLLLKMEVREHFDFVFTPLESSSSYGLVSIGPMVPNSTLLRDPVLVAVTLPTNCLPMRLFSDTPGRL